MINVSKHKFILKEFFYRSSFDNGSYRSDYDIFINSAVDMILGKISYKKFFNNFLEIYVKKSLENYTDSVGSIDPYFYKDFDYDDFYKQNSFLGDHAIIARTVVDGEWCYFVIFEDYIKGIKNIFNDFVTEKVEFGEVDSYTGEFNKL